MSLRARLRAAWAWWRAYRVTLLAPDLSLEVIVTVDDAGGVRAFWTKQVPPLSVCNVLVTAATAIARDEGFSLQIGQGPGPDGAARVIPAAELIGPADGAKRP